LPLSATYIRYQQNPYLQYFCGFREYTPALPCHATELVKFRNRISKDGFEFIFKCSVELHGDDTKESQVIIDSTVQESNMTFPTGGKLTIKLRRSFIKEIKILRIQLRFCRHTKKLKKAHWKLRNK